MYLDISFAPVPEPKADLFPPTCVTLHDHCSTTLLRVSPHNICLFLLHTRLPTALSAKNSAMKRFVPPLLSRRPTASADEPPAKKAKTESSDESARSRSSTPVVAARWPGIKSASTSVKRKPLHSVRNPVAAKATSAPASGAVVTQGDADGAEGYYNVLWYGRSSIAPTC